MNPTATAGFYAKNADCRTKKSVMTNIGFVTRAYLCSVKETKKEV